MVVNMGFCVNKITLASSLRLAYVVLVGFIHSAQRAYVVLVGFIYSALHCFIFGLR